MPRGSKPGERRGGRRRGTPNKRTALRNEAIAAAASSPDISPLDFMLRIMRDSTASLELRIKVAQAAAPFLHAKPGSARPNDPAASAKLIDGARDFIIDPAIAKVLRDGNDRLTALHRKRYAPSEHGGPLNAADEQEESTLQMRLAETARAIACPAGYGPIQARYDSKRLGQLHCKRLTPPSCGGGTLSESEDAEEAQLTARIAVYDESPEGSARHRIFELEFLDCFDGRTTAEQDELDRLRLLYPDLPPDPDDPLKDAIEACSRAYADSLARD